MAADGDGRTGTLAVFGVAVLVNLVLSIFLLDQVRRTREQVANLSNELASKRDVAMLQPIRIDEILDQRCERCHTNRPRWTCTSGCWCWMCPRPGTTRNAS